MRQRSTQAAPRGVRSMQGRSMQAAPRGPLHAVVAVLSNADMRSILMVSLAFQCGLLVASDLQYNPSDITAYPAGWTVANAVECVKCVTTTVRDGRTTVHHVYVGAQRGRSTW